MKRLFIYLFTIFLPISIFPQDYSTIVPLLITKIETGIGNDFLISPMATRSFGIRGICFIGESIIATEGEKRSVIKIDIDGRCSIVLNDVPFKFYFAPYIYHFDSSWITGANQGSVSFIDVETGEGYFIYKNIENTKPLKAIAIKNIAFLWKNSGEIISIKNPTNDDDLNKSRLLSPEQTRQLFAAKDPVIPEGLSIDDKDRLFFKGELYTRDYSQFFDYFMEIYNGRWGFVERHKYHVMAKSQGLVFIGKDTNGFSYWWEPSQNTYFVFDYMGVVTEKIKRPEQSHILPAIHPSGDIYTMSFDEKHAYLWRIERQWGLDGRPVRTGTATGNNLRVREDSVLDARILTTLKENEACTVTAIGKLETIGGNRAPWYKVKTKDGIVGWAWGGFLKIAE